jgi:hypothetical protein
MSRLLEGLVWSLAGFLGGFSLCWFVLRSASTNAVEGAVSSTTRSRRPEIIRAIIGVLILVMVVVSGIRYYQHTNCQTEYNRAVSAALSQRSEAQSQEGQAQVELLTATLSGDSEAIRRETREYIEAITELERARLASPLPPPPDCRRAW